MAKTVKHSKNNESLFGKEKLLEKAQGTSFAALIFEVLSEKAPNSEELKIFELILNLSIDHGEETPSAVETIKAAKMGKTISEGLAAGVLQINDKHGGAIEPAMEFLYAIVKEKKSLTEMVKKYLGEGKTIGGFGHRVYKQSLPSSDGKEADPRAQLILEKLQEYGLGEEFIKIAKQIRQEIFNHSGKALTINIDGAIAVALCGFGWDSKLGKAVFLIARTPGLCAHYINNS